MQPNAPLIAPSGRFVAAGIVQRDEEGNVQRLSKQAMQDLSQQYADLLSAPDVAYEHKWEPGDVMITDNLAIAHRPPAKEEREVIEGLRVLHRTCMMGEHEIGVPM